MKQLDAVGSRRNPLALERELSARLRDSGVYSPSTVRLRVLERQLVIEGFVSDVQQKTAIERVCRGCASGLAVVNRLRVAECDESPAC
jgi:hypothetical protein